MANTGKKIVLTLNEVATPYPPGTPTGNTKPNSIGDPNYIAPYTDLTACPITSDTTCAEVVASGLTGSAEFEFSVRNSVTANTSIAKIKIKLMDSGGTTELYQITYTLPMTPQPNYKSGIFNPVSPANYRVDIDYLNSSDGVVANCPNLATVTVS